MDHAFRWPLAYRITHAVAKELMLVKGVCMTEGPMKKPAPGGQGQDLLVTPKTIMTGAGAMRATAKLGHAFCDIDHHKTLPQSYIDKYGAGLAKVYPGAIMVDAEPVEHVLQDGSKRWQVEFIAACRSPEVYAMVCRGDFKGCSVENFARNKECNEAVCEPQGSAFMYNTFVLEGVPDAAGTWVAPVTEADMGTVLVTAHDAATGQDGISGLLARHAAELHVALPGPEAPPQAPPQAPPTPSTPPASPPASPPTPPASVPAPPAPPAQQHAVVPGNLEAYYHGGQWVNGVDGAKDYLVREKQIQANIFQHIPRHVYDNPQQISALQLTYMTGLDLQAWWTHIHSFTKLASDFEQLKKHVADMAGGTAAPPSTAEGQGQPALQQPGQQQAPPGLIIDDPSRRGISHAIIDPSAMQGGHAAGTTEAERHLENNRQLHAKWLDAEILKQEEIIKSLAVIMPGPDANSRQAALEAARIRLSSLEEKKRFVGD